MSERITLIGQILGTSGYANHARNLFKALVDEGIDVKLKTQIIPGQERLLTDEELIAIKKKDEISRTSIIIDLPQSARFNFPDYEKNIVFVVWEGDKVPKFWIDILRDKRIVQVWTPSEHTRDAILNTCRTDLEACRDIEAKMRTVQHGVDTSVFFPMENKEKNNKFTFVCNKGWNGTMNDRGGVPYLIKAFLSEFKKEEKVRLLIKINPAYMNSTLIEESLKELKKEHSESNAPETLMNFEILTLNQINEFYNKGDCYIVTQFGDSFDLGSAEAMATGIPAIVAGFGGQVEHVTNETGYILKEINLKEISKDMLYEGIKWNEPDISEIRKTMRYVFEHQDEAKEKGIKARQFILDNFTWKKSASKAKEFLKEI